jgi:hypothetical protein
VGGGQKYDEILLKLELEFVSPEYGCTRTELNRVKLNRIQIQIEPS